MLGPVLLRLLCITVTTAAAPHAVTKVSAMTSTVPGSGMDSEGAFSFLGLDTGGSFAVEICQVTDDGYNDGDDDDDDVQNI